MNSLDLTKQLYKNGFITKEAAVKILKQREELINNAIEKRAEEMFKEASWWGKGAPPKGGALFTKSLQNLLPIAGLAGLAALGSTAAKFVASSAADAKLKHDVQKSYSKMFDRYPDLKDSRDEATQHFNVMAKFAPALAANPTVAGTWVKGIMNVGGHIAPDTVRMLIEAQRSWEDVREKRSPAAGFAPAMPTAHKVVETALITSPGEAK